VADDVAAYRLSDGTALVATVDFITPVVDDPYSFGAIGAANALSDLYAKGARPLFALNVVGFPVRSLPLGLLGEILRGGSDKASEAGVSILGGHSIDDHEPKYGLCAIGLADPERLITKAAAQPGDRLVLTKPLGLGIITTGIDEGLVDGDTAAQVIEVMSTLNRAASDAMLEVGVHACTDVTGFVLLGHLRELALASGAGARLSLTDVSVLPAAWELVRARVAPEGTHNNHRFLRDEVEWPEGVLWEEQIVLCDAQTSGGLLMAVPPEREARLVHRLVAAGVQAAVIGEITADRPGRLVVERS